MCAGPSPSPRSFLFTAARALIVEARGAQHPLVPAARPKSDRRVWGRDLHSQTQRATRSRGRLSRFYKNPDGHNEINKNGHSFLLFIFWCFFFLCPLIVFMLPLVICFLFLPCAVLCVSPFCVQTHTIINHTHTQSDTHTRTHRAASPLSVAIKES